MPVKGKGKDWRYSNSSFYFHRQLWILICCINKRSFLPAKQKMARCKLSKLPLLALLMVKHAQPTRMVGANAQNHQSPNSTNEMSLTPNSLTQTSQSFHQSPIKFTGSWNKSDCSLQLASLHSSEITSLTACFQVLMFKPVQTQRLRILCICSSISDIHLFLPVEASWFMLH